MGWFDRIKGAATSVVMGPVVMAASGAKIIANGAQSAASWTKNAAIETGNFVGHFAKNPGRILPCAGQGLLSGVVSVGGWVADGGRFVARNAWNHNPAALISRGTSWGMNKAFGVDLPSVPYWKKPEGSFGASWHEATKHLITEPQNAYEAAAIAGVKAIPETLAITAVVVGTGGVAAPALAAVGVPAYAVTGVVYTTNLASKGVTFNTVVGSTVDASIAGSDYVAEQEYQAALAAAARQEPAPNVGPSFSGASGEPIVADNDPQPTRGSLLDIDPGKLALGSGALLGLSSFFNGAAGNIGKLLAVAGLFIAVRGLFNRASGADGRENAPSLNVTSERELGQNWEGGSYAIKTNDRMPVFAQNDNAPRSKNDNFDLAEDDASVTADLG